MMEMKPSYHPKPVSGNQQTALAPCRLALIADEGQTLTLAQTTERQNSFAYQYAESIVLFAVAVD